MGVLLFKGVWGVGMLKWQTSVVPPASGGNLKEGCNMNSDCAGGITSRADPAINYRPNKSAARQNNSRLAMLRFHAKAVQAV
jgi:hypothetical protein